jgi:hypothetical protein
MGVVFISGGPGCGKSRVLEVLPHLLRKQLLQDAMRMPEDVCRTAFLQLFHEDRLVQIQASAGNGTTLQVVEKDMDGGRIAAIRALYSAFCPVGVPFTSFLSAVVGSDIHFSVADVVSAIAKVKHDYSLAAGADQHPLFVTFAIDEAQELVVDDGGDDSGKTRSKQKSDHP